MKCITEFQDIKGKTIREIVVLDWDSVGLVFIDDTYCIINSKSDYIDGSSSVRLLAYNATNYGIDTEFKLGIITKEEYEKKKAENEKIENKRKEIADYFKYMELKDKFEK